jgi:hypothetical protein
MVSLNITEDTFRRLQAKGRALIDTANDVVVMLLDFHDKYSSEVEAAAAAGGGVDVTDHTVYDAKNPPTLRFAEVDTASLNGELLEVKSWNRVFFETIRQASAILGEGLTNHLATKWIQGKQDGLVHIPDAGISVRGGDADFCWRSIVKLAKAAKFSVLIDFHWPKDQPRSAFPGHKGRLQFDGR